MKLHTSQKFLPVLHSLTFAFAMVCVCVTLTTLPVHAQTYTVLHTFSGADGAVPTSTPILDRGGRLYGTTENGGASGMGVAFQLKSSGPGWVYTRLHDFGPQLGNGVTPLNYGGLTIGPDGAFYGTASEGGLASCGQAYCGLVFRLTPPASICKTTFCPWNYTIVHAFNGDVESPQGSLVFDQAGNMYGTGAFGAFYKLSPSGGSWSETNIGNLPASVYGGLVPDNQGNLYGVWWEDYSDDAGNNGGVFELSPTSSGYVQSVIYRFIGNNDGAKPIGGLTIDAAGNLYGSTSSGGSGGGGTIFELSRSGNGWTFHILCSLTGIAASGPRSALTMDMMGDLYGTTYTGGAHDGGSVFKVSRNGSGWTCTDVHDFDASVISNGVLPIAGVAVDSQGNLYGSTSSGGQPCCGVIWEITP